ncbi:MAG: hypothetical protein [Wendovervirus sonii]|uniref:Uncharacterized protein n=1 Tax=phage Lak_Megaphage_Sonny TaxID=3109229 RepID=A0ABZ0Z420_9CAUD|nr:MAG: hypothetical protein [phage Lak_Megaphage_Sonny]
MSVQSKYFQVTDQILMEYKTDQYKITNLKTVTGEDYTEFYMYQGNDGRQYCLEKNNIPHAKYITDDKFTYYYGGKGVTNIEIDSEEHPIYGGDMYLPNNDILLGTTIKDVSNNVLRTNYINHDTIRLYILTGYLMNNLAGYSIKVYGKASKVSYTNDIGETVIKRINDDVCILDWYLPKEELKDNIHWMSNPLYLNSKFYDRYIEIKLPSVYDAAINHKYRDIDYVYAYTEDTSITYMRGPLDMHAGIFIDFATVQPENASIYNDDNNGSQTFILDVPKTFTIMPTSNSNNFNVRIFENKDMHAIEYYPVYGDIDNAREMTYDIMAAIETGAIPMIDYADMDDANRGMDEFIEMYGEQIFKWIILNELTVTYTYEPIRQNIYDPQKEITMTEYYTNTIDYSNKQNDQTDFWRTKFIPFIQQKIGYSCKSLTLTYTCHLFNRMNNIEIVRAASMVVKEPHKYMLTSINTSNIVQYKIVNKIQNNNATAVSTVNGNTQTAYIKEYYDTTNIIAKDLTNNGTYTQGKMTLKLKRAGSNYMIKLYVRNQDNTLIPYDLSGNTNYKLVFPSASSSKIEILPNNDSAAGTNLIVGQMTFYISADKAAAIMNVPASERYFAVTTHYPGMSQNETSLYEGNVEWYV